MNWKACKEKLSRLNGGTITNLPCGTGENHYKPHSEQAVSGKRYKPGKSRIRSVIFPTFSKQMPGWLSRYSDGLHARRQGFDSLQGQETFLHSVHTGSGAHPTSSIQRVPRKNGQGMNLTTHLHLLPRSKILGIYLHSLIHLHGVVFN
jgi:hypothetical protein